ncbi:MAG: glycosyltransferase family 4 protein [Bacteroidales bacterium]
MKICFYADTIFSYGGVQRVLSNIAIALSKKYDITILTLEDIKAKDLSMYGLKNSSLRFYFLKYKGLKIWEWFPCKTYGFLYKKILPKNALTSKLYGYSSFPLSRRKKLIKFINEENFDVVIGVHAFLSLHLASIRNQIKSKTIGWMHTSYDAFFNTPNFYLWGQKERFSYEMKRLDKIVVLTKNDKDLLDENLGIKSEVIYNPLTLIPIGKGSPENKKFLAVGRLIYLTKGFDILIKAFNVFSKQNKEWTLDIVGEGPDETFLKQLIKDYNLGKRIIIHPFSNNVQKYYASASIYILSSRWEGFGLVLLEAMAHNLPIIASKIPVTCEILNKSGANVFFESENFNDLAKKMIKMVNSDNLKEMGEKAYSYSQKFDISYIIKKWEKLLSNL